MGQETATSLARKAIIVVFSSPPRETEKRRESSKTGTAAECHRCQVEDKISANLRETFFYSLSLSLSKGEPIKGGLYERVKEKGGEVKKKARRMVIPKTTAGETKTGTKETAVRFNR